MKKIFIAVSAVFAAYVALVSAFQNSVEERVVQAEVLPEQVENLSESPEKTVQLTGTVHYGGELFITDTGEQWGSMDAYLDGQLDAYRPAVEINTLYDVTAPMLALNLSDTNYTMGQCLLSHEFQVKNLRSIGVSGADDVYYIGYVHLPEGITAQTELKGQQQHADCGSDYLILLTDRSVYAFLNPVE